MILSEKVVNSDKEVVMQPFFSVSELDVTVEVVDTVFRTQQKQILAAEPRRQEDGRRR